MKNRFKGLWNKATEKAADVTKDIRDKAVEIKDSEKFNKVVDKVVESVTEPKTAEEHVKDGAAGAALTVIAGVVTGGASIPVAIAWAVGEEAAVNVISKSKFGKRLAESRRNRKPGNDPKPPQQ
jgi:hypothetical protein